MGTFLVETYGERENGHCASVVECELFYVG